MLVNVVTCFTPASNVLVNASVLSVRSYVTDQYHHYLVSSCHCPVSLLSVIMSMFSDMTLLSVIVSLLSIIMSLLSDIRCHCHLLNILC